MKNTTESASSNPGHAIPPQKHSELFERVAGIICDRVPMTPCTGGPELPAHLRRDTP